MTIQEALEKLQGYEKATFALNHAAGLMYYDGATTAPKGTAELRGSTLGELSRMGYELTTAPETVEMLRTLMENREELDPPCPGGGICGLSGAVRQVRRRMA